MIKEIEICHIDDVPEKTPKCVQLEGIYFAIYRYENKWIAIKDECPHQMASFEGRPVEDDVITCAFHGWKYNLITGEAVKGFGCLTKYPVKVVNNKIIVEFTIDDGENQYTNFIK